MSARPAIAALESRRRAVRVSLPVLGALAVAAAAAVRGRARDVLEVIGDVRPGAILVLVAILAVHRLANAAMHTASVGSVPMRKMALATEVQLGASSSSIVGGSIGTGVRVAMLRSWGVEAPAIAVALVVTSAVPSIAMWTIAGVHAGARIVSGHAGRTDVAVGVGAVTVWAIVACAAHVLLRGRSRLAVQVERLHEAAVDRTRGRVRRVISSLHPESVRVTASHVLTAQGVVLLAAAITAQLALAVLVSASAVAVAPGAAVSVWAIARVFSTLRVLSSFVPIPGGLGIVDVGLVSALVGQGLTSTQALSAVALYRGITFVLPMLTGPCCALLWWAKARPSHAEHHHDALVVSARTSAA